MRSRLFLTRKWGSKSYSIPIVLPVFSVNTRVPGLESQFAPSPAPIRADGDRRAWGISGEIDWTRRIHADLDFAHPGFATMGTIVLLVGLFAFVLLSIGFLAYVLREPVE